MRLLEGIIIGINLIFFSMVGITVLIGLVTYATMGI